MNKPEAEPQGIKQNSPQISQIHADKFSIICAICGKRNNNKIAYAHPEAEPRGIHQDKKN